MIGDRQKTEQGFLVARLGGVAAALGLLLSAATVLGEDYEAARHHPQHFKPAIETAQDADCLACHREILDRPIRTASPAGRSVTTLRAWYQTLDTYRGEQDDFHRRHLTAPHARQVMDLRCNTCHQGSDPREQAPAPEAMDPGFTLRKTVDTAETCLLCHGQFPYRNMAGLEGPWPEQRKNFETDDLKNGCLACHGEGGFRPNRHRVNYLKAEAIEELAKTQADACYGCHGGRAWYRIAYPYPRHAWDGMETDIPDWAKHRPTESKARFRAGMGKRGQGER